MAPSNREQSRMFRFSSLVVNSPKCRIFLELVNTGGGVQLFSRTPATKSSIVLPRPSWVAPYSLSVIEIALYCLVGARFEAFLTRMLKPLFLCMVVDSFGNRGLSVLGRHSCSNVSVTVV